MVKRWEELDVDALRACYELEQQQLANALLKGATWEEVSETRRNVTELSILLYRRYSGNPAEYQSNRQNNPL